MFDYRRVPLLNTLVLLRSGLSITLSHYYYFLNFYSMSLIYLIVTLFLGFTFSFFQYMEYVSSFFTINDSRFGRLFYVLTGFHGIHVLVGRIFISCVLFRSFFMIIRVDSIVSFDLCSWYWHFVDVV